jgi:hypothetical protein
MYFAVYLATPWAGRAGLSPSVFMEAGRLSPRLSSLTYANQLVFWKGRVYMLGTVWNDEQDFVCDPISVEFTDTGVRIVG